HEVLTAPVGVEQVLKHSEQEVVSLGVGDAELVIAFGIFAQRRVFRMLQDERIVRRSVNVRNELDVILQGLVREFLQLGARERVRLDDRRGALVLEMSLQLDGESVNLEERRLAKRAFQDIDVFEVMRVIPVDDAKLQVGPINDFPFRQPEITSLRLEQLNEGLHA